jgi:putative glutamine amidotransferase
MTDGPQGRVVVGIAAHQALVEEAGSQVRHHVTNSAYVKAVRKAGGIPVLLPLIEPGDVDAFLSSVGGVVLTGGDDVDPSAYGKEPDPRTGRTDRERDELEMVLARAAVERNVPTLAICRGCQILNVALGGELAQHVDDHFDLDRYNETVHVVEIAPAAGIRRWLGSAGEEALSVNSLHHQAVTVPGRGLVVTARAADGTVEALEVDGAPDVLGVQWHPELVRHRPEHLALFRSLVERASRRAPAAV